jgi:hypothetical protein
MDNEKKQASDECSMNQTDAQGHSDLCCCYIIDEDGEYDDPCFQPVDDGCCCG